MDYEKLRNEMNNLLELMEKESPDSDRYEGYVKRLGDLQAIEIKWRELELSEAQQAAEESLKRREILAAESETRQRGRSSVIDGLIRLFGAIIGVAGTAATVAEIMFIEENDIIRTKAFSLVGKLLPKI